MKEEEFEIAAFMETSLILAWHCHIEKLVLFRTLFSDIGRSIRLSGLPEAHIPKRCF